MTRRVKRLTDEHEPVSAKAEYRARCRQNERCGNSLCLTCSTDGVVIEGVLFPSLSRVAVQPVGWELDLDPRFSSLSGAAGRHSAVEPERYRTGAHVVLAELPIDSAVRRLEAAS